jgi:hypothetical protein
MSQITDVPTPSNQPLPTSGKAIASLVLGIVSIPACIFYGLPAIICGILAVVFYKSAMEQINTGQSNPGSAGLAKAGMICGFVGLGLGAIYFVIALIAIIVMIANS